MHDPIWYPFTAMKAFAADDVPVITAAEGFELIDDEGRCYLDGISSLWCNVHGHRVPEIDRAIREQLDRVAHTTLLGLASAPSQQLAHRLVEITPQNLTRVFYSDSGATAVEAALKIAWQYQRQRPGGSDSRNLFATISGAYHGDTIGSVSVGSIPLFHSIYGKMLFKTVSFPSPGSYRLPPGYTRESYQQACEDELERVLTEHADEIAAFVIEPLVQGAAGILVHPAGFLRRVRELTRDLDIPLIADEVAVGFGRTGTMFACEQEQVEPDLMCLAKGLTGGYLPLAATLATEPIFEAFLAEPHEGRSFYHGHTYTGNPLGCAAALASLDLFESKSVLANINENSNRLAQNLSALDGHRHVGEVRQKGIMVGIELVADRRGKVPFRPEQGIGHSVTLAARKRGVIIRPLGDVVVLMPAPAMPGALIDRLCRVVAEAIDEATQHVFDS